MVVSLLWPEEELIPYSEHLYNRELCEHFHWVEKEYGLTPLSIGGSMPSGLVLKADASVRGKRDVSEDEAREVFLNCIQDLLRRFNGSKELRPYLIRYPFTSDLVDYSISFDDLAEGSVLPPSISCITAFRNTLLYKVWDPQKEKRTEILRETHEEAERKYREAVNSREATTGASRG